MASISSRRSCFSARPPRPAVLPGGGSSGAMIAPWASVVAEDGYTAQRGSRERRSPPAVWVGQDAQVQGGEDDTRTPGRWWPRHLPAYQESACPRRQPRSRTRSQTTRVPDRADHLHGEPSMAPRSERCDGQPVDATTSDDPRSEPIGGGGCGGGGAGEGVF